MTAEEERDLLLELAKDLLSQLKQVSSLTHQLSAALVGKADKLMLLAADEKDAKRNVTVRRVVTKPKVETTPPSGSGRNARTCHNCGNTGHDSRNCPKKKR